MTLREKQVLDPAPGPGPLLGRRPPLPLFSWGLMAVAIARFLYENQLSHSPGEARWALYGPWVRTGEWWRLLAYALEHGSVLHIFFNMWVVYTLGTALERILGTWRFALISVASCLGAAAFVLFFAFDSKTVGASGMILGWAGAMLPISTQAGRRSLVTWLVQVAIISLLPGVSWQGHLGGFLFGLPFGLALRAGPRVFSYAAPVMLFVSAAAAVFAAHPGRLPF